MLTYEDCLDYCELTQEEVDAVAAHEHCCRLQALALAGALMQSSEGREQLARMLAEMILHARVQGDVRRERELERILAGFCRRHPLAMAS